MTDLDQAALNLLTARWETAANILWDLGREADAGRFKGPVVPGAVPESLERLAVMGKAEFDLAHGWRLMPERPKVDQQKGLW